MPSIISARTLSEVRSMLGRQGMPCRDLEVLSCHEAGRKRSRMTLRASLGDGSTVKVRCFESADEAARQVELRRGISRSFVPVLARHDAMLIETWVDGCELSIPDADLRAADMGALLASLHSTRRSAERPGAGSHDRRARAHEHLEALARADILPRHSAEGLQTELLRTDPGESPLTLVHLDFCPENVVVDTAGGLHVVDNEWMAIGAPGADLGRTYSRWLTSGETWGRFMEGYLSTASIDPVALRFWLIVMAAASAVVRLGQAPARLETPVARLNELAAALQIA